VRLERSIPAAALDAIRAPLLAAGATPVDAPVLQPLGLLLDLAGEAMRSRLFVVSGDGGEEACLRPDFTVAVAREHFADGAGEPGRCFYEGKAFRVAPRGSDRAEEFLQVGVEAFEAGDPVAADAEIAALAWAASAAGGRADLSLMLGDVSLFSAFVDSLELAAPLAARLKRAFAKPRQLKAELDGEGVSSTAEQSRIAALLAGLPEAEASAMLQELWSLAGIEPVGGRRPAEIARRLVEKARSAEAGRLSPAQADKVRAFLAVSDRPEAALDAIVALAGPDDAGLKAAVAGWRARLAGMAARGVPLEKATLAAAFGRAFGYYDGLLFEVRSAALGDEAPVAAGGRYDGLPGRLGVTTTTGAVGCMVRPARAYAGGQA